MPGLAGKLLRTSVRYFRARHAVPLHFFICYERARGTGYLTRNKRVRAPCPRRHFALRDARTVPLVPFRDGRNFPFVPVMKISKNTTSRYCIETLAERQDPITEIDDIAGTHVACSSLQHC